MASKHTRALLALVAATSAAIACSGSSGAPAITTLDPPSARNTLPVTVTITGKNFYRKIVPDAANSSHSTAEDLSVTFSNGTHSFELTASSNSTPSEIIVSIPADPPNHPLGLWTVTVHADGGDATLADGFTFAGPPTQIKVSSAAEPAPGTINSVTLTATTYDAADNVTTLDSSIGLTVQLLGAGTSALAMPSSLSIPAGQSSAVFDVTDPRVESFGVTVTPSIALGVSSGIATFIAGPAYRGHVLSAAEPSPFTSNSADTTVVIEDIDRNPVAVHSTTYHFTFALTGGTCPPTANVSPTSVNIVDGMSSAPITVNCTGSNATTETVITGITPSGSLIASNGYITFTP